MITLIFLYFLYIQHNIIMGNKCIGKCDSASKKRPLHQLLPTDIQKFNPDNLGYSLPKILFEAQIFNIQMMKCPEGSYSLNFQITDVISMMLPQKQVEKKPKNNDNSSDKQLQWKTHQKFGFEMTEYELRSKFLVVQVFGDKKSKINEIAINLYMIATGPQHHDLQIKVGKDKFSRLKFDFKISEVVQVSMDIDQIKLQFDQDFEGEQFDYSFKIIRNNQVISYSESSCPKFVKSPEQKNIYRQPTLDDECKSPLKFRRTSNTNKMIKRDLKSFIQWGQGDKKDTSLMSIAAKLLSNDINKSFFYFLIWKFPKIEGSQQNSNNKDDWNLFAGALINFNKLFEKPYEQKKMIINAETQSSSIQQQKIGFDIEERIILIEQQMWGEDGNSSIGKCLIKLNMKSPKFEKQLQACARTQDGIVNMTFLFKSYIGKNTRLQNGKISKVMQKYIEIEQIFQRLTRLPNDNYSSRSQILMLEEQAYQSFQQMAKILKQTMAQSMVVLSSLNPEQIKDLIQDQMLLIDLLNKLYFSINDNTVFAGICWEIVLLIMKRGEFYLENIGFIGLDKNNNLVLQKKIKTAIKYQDILYKYFVLALKSQASTLRNSINSNIEGYKAYCYIKIPHFRQKIIDSIQKAYDQDIVQFKLQHLQSVTSEISSLLKNSKDRSMINLNWDEYFHDQIKGNSQNQSLERQVQEQIQNSRWIQEISKRQDAFFNFTAELVKRLNQITMRVKTWKWNYFPGYTKIVRGFMVEMKKRKIMDYPILMIKTSSQLLANEELVNVLMPIIIQKTNSFKKVEVLRCIAILESFFNCLSDHQTKPLPRTFNYLYFFKTFKLIIQNTENTEAIVKSLILVYDFYEWLSPQWRDNITMYLLGKVFFRFFFHWSYQIRIIFYNFIIIKVKYLRIQKMSKLPSNSQSKQMNSKIAQRYDQISTVLLNIQNEKKQNVMDYRTLFQKDLYKKMKNRMRKKRQQRQKNTKNKKQGSTKDTPSNKQSEGKISERYILQNLLIPRNGLRKKTNTEEEIRNRSSTQFNFQKMDEHQSPKQEDLHITRGNSFCMDISTAENSRKLSSDVPLQDKKRSMRQDDQNSLDQILDLKIRRHGKQSRVNGRMGRPVLDLKKINTKLNYNIYNRQDHELSEISQTQINYVCKGIQEYRDTLMQINKYYQKRGELPKRQLQIQPFLSDQV